MLDMPAMANIARHVDIPRSVREDALMPAGKQKTYGLPILDTAPNPSDRLYEAVLASLGQGAWQRFGVVKGNAIAKETRLARGTVTRALTRLQSEGILEAL